MLPKHLGNLLAQHTHTATLASWTCIQCLMNIKANLLHNTRMALVGQKHLVCLVVWAVTDQVSRRTSALPSDTKDRCSQIKLTEQVMPTQCTRNERQRAGHIRMSGFSSVHTKVCLMHKYVCNIVVLSCIKPHLCIKKSYLLPVLPPLAHGTH